MKYSESLPWIYFKLNKKLLMRVVIVLVVMAAPNWGGPYRSLAWGPGIRGDPAASAAIRQ